MAGRAPLERLFVHFFDVHYLDQVLGRQPPSQRVQREAALAVRLALLAANEVLVPAASYFESPLCRTIVDSYEDIYDRGCLFIVGGGSSLGEFAESKLTQYAPGSDQAKVYRTLQLGGDRAPPFRRRGRSATEDLVSYWLETMEAPGFPTAVLGKRTALPRDLEKSWADVPEKLGPSAFITDYVIPIIVPEPAGLILRNRIHGVINAGYFASYAREWNAGLITDMIFIPAGGPLASGGVDLPYKRFREGLRDRGALEWVQRASPDELLALREAPEVVAALVSALEGQGGAPSQLYLLPRDAIEDLDARLANLRLIRSGRQTATAYHRAIESFFSAAFRFSLIDPRIEEDIDEGRKRVDIMYKNTATEGFFRLVRDDHAARQVVIECKNYRGEIGNADVDQLAGRFAPWRTRFGILACRQLVNRPLLIERCRDTARAGRGVIVPLEDKDLPMLVRHGIDPSWGSAQSEFLFKRLSEVQA
jgi:hypothetical protein